VRFLVFPRGSDTPVAVVLPVDPVVPDPDEPAQTDDV
jgi:hypothetical protein